MRLRMGQPTCALVFLEPWADVGAFCPIDDGSKVVRYTTQGCRGRTTFRVASSTSHFASWYSQGWNKKRKWVRAHQEVLCQPHSPLGQVELVQLYGTPHVISAFLLLIALSLTRLALHRWWVVSKDDGFAFVALIGLSNSVVAIGVVGLFPVLHDVRERQSLVLIQSLEHEVLGVEVGESVQQDLTETQSCYSYSVNTSEQLTCGLWAPNCLVSHKCSSSILVTK